jgi:hypothetical protein
MRHHFTLPGAPGRAGFAAALVLAVLLAGLVAWLSLQPRSRPVPDGPRPASFVVARALAHVQVLARAPRPVGSSANAQARAYLADQVRALGLVPEVQTETVQTSSSDLTGNVRVTVAVVHNVLVRKPGRAGAQAPAVLAVAHYDSGGMTLGAADGAMSAAAMLEALRALQAGPQPANDLLFVFTDADAAQALGTRGFAQSHPWTRRARVTLRFDNPGNRGPLALADASHADGFALDGWARVAPAPHGSSLMAELYAGLRPQPANALLAEGGGALLQFATRGGTLGPNAIHDVPQRLSADSLQHEGDTMLALLRHFGDAGLMTQATSRRGQVFFVLPVLGVVHYSYLLVWPLSALAGLLTVLACRAGIRQQRIPLGDIVHATFGFLFMAAGATFAAHLCHEALPDLQGRYDAGVLADGAGVRWQVLAFALLPAAGFVVLQRHLQQRFGALCTLLGVLCLLSVGLVALSAGAPGASYVLAWPLLAMQAAVLFLMSERGRTWPAWRRFTVLGAAMLPACALMLPALRDSLAWLSPSWLLLPSSLACSLLGLGGLLLDGLGRRFVVRSLLVGAAASIGLAYAATPLRPALPAPNQLVYFKDYPSWQAFWLYPPLPLDAWTRALFPNTMHPYQLPYLFGPSAGPVWYTAAPRNDGVAYPDLMVEKVSWSRDSRHVEFLLRSKNRAPEIVVRIDGADPLRTSVNGRVLTDRLYRGWKLTLHGMGDQDLRFAFELRGDPEFQVYVQERMPGLPERDLPPRPAGMRPALLPLTGTTVAADILRFR